MEIIPNFPWGKAVIALPSLPPSLRPLRSGTRGGIHLQSFALLIALRISGPGRELTVTSNTSRVVRIRVREPLGKAGGLRTSGYFHIHDCGFVAVSGAACERLAGLVVPLCNSDIICAFSL